MSAETQDSMSELVYLFVDGETTSAQEEILFNNLAGNPDLQQELQEAILIRSTLEQDCSALAVPPETTAAIFHKAGFALPGASAGLSIGTIFGSTVELLRSIALPIAFSIGGAAIATVYFLSQSQNPDEMESLTKRNSTLSSITNSSQILTSNADITNVLIEDERPKRAKSSIADNFSVNKLQTESHNDFDHVVAQDITVNEPETVSTEEKTQTISSISNSPYKNVNFNTKIHDNSPVSHAIPTQSLISKDKFLDMAEKQPITLSLRGLMNMSTLPSFGKSTTNEEFTDLAVSLGYALSDNITIGIEGGRQSLRYYTFENGKNENATLNSTITWAGAYYRQVFPSLSVSQISPFGQVTLGGTFSGPSGRFLTGLRWQPDSRVSLSAGVEGSAFLYQNSSQWYSLRSLGLMYQIDVNF